MISVIMPFYNNAPTLKASIESVLTQIYPDFELILVNDGSTDKGIEIVESFNDKRIRLIQKDNGGVSSARNEGLRQAKGEYCTFIDADDCYQANFLAFLNQYNAYDLVGCGITYIPKQEKCINPNFDLKGSAIVDHMDKLINSGCLNSPVTKLYRLSIIRENQLSFPEDMAIGEDFNFNFRYMQACQSIKILPEALYEYHQQNSGLHNKPVEEVLTQRKKNIDLIEQYYNEHQLDKTLVNQMKIKLVYIYAMQQLDKNIDKMTLESNLYDATFSTIGQVTGMPYKIMKTVYQSHKVSWVMLLARIMRKLQNKGKRIDGASV